MSYEVCYGVSYGVLYELINVVSYGVVYEAHCAA